MPGTIEADMGRRGCGSRSEPDQRHGSLADREINLVRDAHFSLDSDSRSVELRTWNA